MPIKRIVSGGQTGVDRGALDAAIAAGVAHGGWCPLGRRAEDGRIPDQYALQETETRKYAERTRRNVRDSDATLIIAREPLAGGTALTQRVCDELGKPWLVVNPDRPPIESIQRWLRRHKVESLNVAGPRESSSPGIEAQARDLVLAVLNAPITPRRSKSRPEAALTARERDRFDALLEEVLAELPGWVLKLLDEVPLIVEDHPSDELVKELELEDPGDLCGLHDAIPLTEPEARHHRHLPEQLFIFREGVLNSAADDEGRVRKSELRRQIRITVLHEIGHHCGLEEEDLEELGYG